MSNLKVSISARLYDRHGILTRKYRPKAAHSFLAQLIEILHCQMKQASTPVNIIDGSESTISPNAFNLRLTSGASSFTYGLLIGSGTDKVTINDYVLQTPITTDITASVHTFVLSYPSTNIRRLAISRTFTNTSESPISIEEVALQTMTSGAEYICLDRTLYSISIPASSSLTLTYRIDVSISNPS